MKSPTRRYRIGIALLLCAACATLSGCERAQTTGDGRPQVVATTMQIGDLVGRIAGDRVNLTVIMGPGIDPHTYKPTPADMGRMRQADRVFYNGLYLEGRMTDLFERRADGSAVPATRDIPQDRLLPWEEGDYGAFDPHVWFDVELWMIAAQTVRDELIAIDPDHAEEYRQRTETLLAEMRELHRHIQDRVASLPENRRVLITSHDAYGYFGQAYGIDVRGIQGISTDGEAGLATIAAAVNFIIQNEIPAIFVESSVSPRAIERVRADCRARGFDVRIGGELYSDAMGAPGERPGYAVETYDGMMRYNVDTIVEGLK